MHTDTEIITSEILHHRLIGRFTERVQYLRRAMVVPIDAPKTIRGEILVDMNEGLIQGHYTFAEK